ncbi:O-methyltransferase [Gleimia hominis]|uniref:O-methyltransferase n=1 Tax=Gleimia hominis TaxID=595468 RepID=UPI001E53954F|nr:O-methyltransferase [Gleimia hominis]WIK65374.1 O-methyltransferase [Gleimia hominis]
MSTDKALSWSYCEDFVPEGDVIAATRMQAEELGCTPISPGTGSALRTLVATCGAKAVTEIGTGVGVSGLWLLSGMREGAVLTTIDHETEFHRVARAAFAAAGSRPPRTRLITDRALDVLPRMAAHAYDMVFVDATPSENAAYIQHAARMLRPGGVLAYAHALWHDTVADPARREPGTVTMRQLNKELAESDQFITNLLPVGDGLLIAVRQ